MWIPLAFGLVVGLSYAIISVVKKGSQLPLTKTDSGIWQKDKGNEKLRSLYYAILKLIVMYENVKPILYYNFAYALSFYDIKNGALRSRKLQQRYWFSSYFNPTGGWFALFLFRRHIKRTFKSVLSTCDVYRCEMEMDGKCSKMDKKLIDKIFKKVIEKQNDLTKRKSPNRAAHITSALQLASIITGFITLSGLLTILPNIPNIPGGISVPFTPLKLSQLYAAIIISFFSLSIALLLMWVLILSKVWWYRIIKKTYNFKDKEEPVYGFLEDLLKFVEVNSTNTVLQADKIKNVFMIVRTWFS